MPSKDEDERAAKAREIKAAYQRMWQAKNREHRRAYEQAYYDKKKGTIQAKRREARAEAWRKEHPDAVLEHKRRYREANREKLREAHRKYIRDETGGMNEAYEARRARNYTNWRQDLEDMAGRPRPEVCDACGGPPDPKRGMHFDHCHTHGHFRGWICRGCNLALGNVGDDPARLLKLIAYLKRTSRKASDQFSLPGV